MHSDAQIIILAGGKGKRMGGEAPKVLTLFSGKPILENSLSAALELGLPQKPVVVVGFGAQLVKDYVGDRAVCALQESQLGTGHAVLCAKEKVGSETKKIIVLYGDHPNTKAETIRRLLDIHEEEKPVISMMTLRVPDFTGIYSCFNGFGRVLRDSNGKIVRIIELKDASEEEKKICELNPSLFCFNADWLWESLPKLKNSNAQGEFYLTDLVGMAIQEGRKIITSKIDYKECLGVNTPDDLRIAEEIILAK